ncbi:hypothetical protein VPH35_020586 [Triticum aestivum]
MNTKSIYLTCFACFVECFPVFLSMVFFIISNIQHYTMSHRIADSAHTPTYFTSVTCGTIFLWDRRGDDPKNWKEWCSHVLSYPGKSIQQNKRDMFVAFEGVLMSAREPRGFGFVQYFNPDDAADGKYYMDGQVICGKQVTVLFA